MSGADLQNLSTRRPCWPRAPGRNKIEQVDFDRAADRVLLGAKREEPFTDEEKRRTAYHEAGPRPVRVAEPKARQASTACRSSRAAGPAA